MKPVIFVTGNENKVREAEAVIGVHFTQRQHNLDEVQELDLKKVVEHKARQAYAIYKQPLIVEDVSFEIEQWRGFPGPFAKWLGKTIGYGELATTLKKGNRRALWRAMYAYNDGKQIRFFEGREQGSVAHKPRGTTGFGFDIIFIPAGKKKTVAELGPEQKAKTSARYLALCKLKKFLQAL